jgi:hypothetical protein
MEGAIALITTVRLVFSNANFQTNREIFRTIFERLPDGSRPALGDVVQLTKLGLAGGFLTSNGENNRKFTLLGDPALQPGLSRLSGPDHHGQRLARRRAVTDTLRGLAKVQVSGELRDMPATCSTATMAGSIPTIYDKASTLSKR